MQIGGHFPKEKRRWIKTLAAAQDRSIEELLDEALDLLFEKYGVSENAA